MAIPTMEQITQQVGVAVGKESILFLASQNLNQAITSHESEVTDILAKVADTASTISTVMKWVSVAALPTMLLLGLAPIGAIALEAAGITADTTSWIGWGASKVGSVMMGLESTAYSMNGTSSLFRGYYAIQKAGTQKVETLAETQATNLNKTQQSDNKIVTQIFKTDAALGRGIKEAIGGALVVATNYKG